MSTFNSRKNFPSISFFFVRLTVRVDKSAISYDEYLWLVLLYVHKNISWSITDGRRDATNLYDVMLMENNKFAWYVCVSVFCMLTLVIVLSIDVET